MAVLVYVLVSLVTAHGNVDFDRLFRRGRFAPEVKPGEPAEYQHGASPDVPGWQRKLGITDEFTRGDKWIYALKYALFGWTFGVGFLGVSLLWLLGWMRTDGAWITWWTIHLTLIGLVSILATVWFLVGGFRDLFRLFARLRTLQRDEDDDGTVTRHLGGAAEEEHPTPAADPKP